MKTKTFFLFFSFLLVFSFVEAAYAEGEVNLNDVPSYLANQLGTSVFIGGLIASTILMALCVLPIVVLTRSQNILLVFGIMPLGISIALGWLPVWFFAIIILLIAFGFASTISKTISRM